MFSDENVV